MPLFWNLCEELLNYKKMVHFFNMHYSLIGYISESIFKHIIITKSSHPKTQDHQCELNMFNGINNVCISNVFKFILKFNSLHNSRKMYIRKV